MVRLALDFTLAAVNAERKRHATIPYGIFLIRVFVGGSVANRWAQSRQETTNINNEDLFNLGSETPSSKIGEEREKGQEEERFFCPRNHCQEVQAFW